MAKISSKFRNWGDPATGDEGLTYWCQGCDSIHSTKTKGAGAWGWNGDIERPVFTPSVMLTSTRLTEKGEAEMEAWRACGMPARDGVKFDSIPYICHSFVGCNGAQPGEVIFLRDCTHSFAGQTVALPDFPKWSEE